MPIDDIVAVRDAGELVFARGNGGTVSDIANSSQVMEEIPAVTGGGLTSFGYGSA